MKGLRMEAEPPPLLPDCSVSCRSLHKLALLERLDLGSNEFSELVRTQGLEQV